MLYVALVVMVIMMLAGVSLLRSAGMGQGVAGNVAFKQNATSAGEMGVTDAMGYVGKATALDKEKDQEANGYFATWDEAFDYKTFAWDTSKFVQVSTRDDGNGDKVRYVVHRLCKNVGSLAGNDCVSVMDSTTLGLGGGGASGASGIAAAPPAPYFRVTSRIDGPRGTVSYTQVIVK